jgi:uncharacterized membrane protein (DUF485 family)
VSQTRLGSFAEAWFNVAVGFGINFAGNIFILPLFGFNVTAGQAFGIGVIFTVISVARSYVLRRVMNSYKAKWNMEHKPANE